MAADFGSLKRRQPTLRIKNRLVLATLLLTAPSGGAADGVTVQNMIPGCEEAASYVAGAEVPSRDAVFCMGIAGGLAQILSYNCRVAEVSEVLPNFMAAEVPPNNSASAQAFVNWARANPARWEDDFYTAFTYVLAETFSCEAAPFHAPNGRWPE